MTEFIFAMSAQEMSEYLHNDFHDLPDDARRCIATMMAMILDHNEFLEDQGLTEKFEFEYDNNEGELH
jgi:hypothetical protein